MARYLSTTLPYVNADPHLGHALEFVQADTYARMFRLNGEEVFFNIGADEHGAKIAQKAEKEGKSPSQYVDEYTARLKTFADALNISYDSFIRTTDPHHIKAAQEFWSKCKDAGDIYKANYETKYCVGCELEKTDSELVDDHCPLHPNLKVEIREEENYYFRFSRYQEVLLQRYAAQKDFVVPEGRMRELISFVSAGLKDFSISRRREKLAWGVPVPEDDDQVMYVWFDALVNYISAIGWPRDEENFNKWWPALQFAGKDNLRQQAAMWQAMLLSAGLPLSRQIFIHGFITSGGQKMSKSLGNSIDPLKLIQKYGKDALRYVLLRHVNPIEDSDLTEDAVHEHYTANLVNGLGNLVARVMRLVEDNEVRASLSELQFPPAIGEAVNSFRFNDAMDIIWRNIGILDQRITEEEPYKVIKRNPAEGKIIIQQLVSELWEISKNLKPFMPSTAEKIIQAIKNNRKPENLFPRLA